MQDKPANPLLTIKDRVIKLARRQKELTADFKSKLEAEKKKANIIITNQKNEIDELNQQLAAGPGGNPKELKKLKEENSALKKDLEHAHEKIHDLKEELREEITKNANIKQSGGHQNTSDLERQLHDAKMQIDDLKRELRDEITRGASSSHKDADTSYLEAQIASLKANLEAEMTKTTTVKIESANEINKMKGEFQKSSKELEDEIEELRRGLQEEQITSKKKINQLGTENEKNKETIKTLQNSFDSGQKEGEQSAKIIEDLTNEANNLKQLSQDKQAEFEESLKQKEEQIATLNQNIEKSQAEITELIDVTRKYDIMKIFDQVEKLKVKARESIERADQKELKLLLKEVIELDIVTKRCDKNLRDLSSNLHNQIYEMDNMVKNSIYTVETSM
ncbi:MAG: hypothetical protein ISR65_00290 [Bacteriovoracaceae bacterium]|nr:hypothetical protein [Bacteriovoracaceae bacterium]